MNDLTNDLLFIRLQMFYSFTFPFLMLQLLRKITVEFYSKYVLPTQHSFIVRPRPL